MREALLAAALARFAADGIASTSLDAIRRDAGASVGSLYHAFPGGMADLVTTLYVETLADYQQSFSRELHRATDARDGVERIVGFHLRWHARHRDAARFLHSVREPELRAATDRELRDRNAEFFAEIRGWLSPHVRAGTLRDLPIALLHALWLGPSQEYCRQWLTGAVGRPSRTTSATLADAAWRALRTDKSEKGDA